MKKLLIRILKYLVPVSYGAGVILLALGMAFPAINGPVYSAGLQQVSGAIYTTDSLCNSTNDNVFYLNKEAVYLDGGPRHGGSDTLKDGDYYVQVTSPDGQVLGTSIGTGNETPVHVTGGSFDQCYQLWSILRYPGGGQGYDDTPNNGGEYKAWVSTVSDFTNGDTKTDNFKVQKEVPPTATTVPPTPTHTNVPPTHTPTGTLIPPTETPTSTPTNTQPADTSTPTPTATATLPIPGDTPTPTHTATSTLEVPTATFTYTPTNTQPVPGDSPTPTHTATVTNVAPTATFTVTPTNTQQSPGDTPTPTDTKTPDNPQAPTPTSTNPPQNPPGDQPSSTPIPTKVIPPASGTKVLIPQTGVDLTARSEAIHNQSMLFVNLGVVLFGFGLVMHGLYLKLLQK